MIVRLRLPSIRRARRRSLVRRPVIPPDPAPAPRAARSIRRSMRSALARAAPPSPVAAAHRPPGVDRASPAIAIGEAVLWTRRPRSSRSRRRRSSARPSRSSACWRCWSPSSGRGRRWARPPWPSTPRAASAIACRAPWSSRSGSRPRPAPADDLRPRRSDERPFDEAAETDRFVRRQRRDALAALRIARRACSSRASRARPACRAGRGCALLVPVLAPAEPAGRGRSRSSATSAKPPTGRPTGSTSSPRSSESKGGEAERPADASSPRSCASWPASSASSPTSSPRTCASSARSRATSAPGSIRPTEQRRIGDDVAGALAVAGRDRQPGRQPRWRSRRRRSEDLEELGDKLDEHDARGAARARAAARRDGVDRVQRRRRRGDRAARRGPEPGPGRHRGRPVGARSAR